MILNLALTNATLYRDIDILETGGRLSFNLTEEALNIIGRNVDKLIEQADNRDKIVLTGAAPIPVYLVVFHQVVHRFKKVIYDNEMYNLVIARH